MNTFVRSFVTAEFFFWSAWNSIIPIMSIFIIKAIPQTDITTASLLYGVHSLVRVIVELLAGKYEAKSTQNQKIIYVVIGIIICVMAYLLLALVQDMFYIVIAYILIGVGIGISSPSKFALFSRNLDKKKETFEWSFYDSATLIGSATAVIIAGYVVHFLGFQTLFALAACLNLAAAFLYVALIKR